MGNNDQYRPMVEIAEEIIRKNGKQNLNTLIETVGKIKGFTTDDVEKATLLYLDMTLSSKFVYCGNDEWDVKENNLDLWDKDGSYFMKIDEVDFDDDEEEEEIVLEDYYSVSDDDFEDLSDEEDEEDLIDEDKEDDVEDLLDDDIPFYSTDDDDVDVPDLDFDDDDYHDIMDDYEDMYDD